MRNMLPKVPILGNLTADPKVFGENTDTPRAVFSIAVNYGWDPEEKSFKHNAFYQITYFGEAGMNFANSFSKGSRIFALCSLGNHTKVAYDYDEDKEEVTEFNQTLLTLNADYAGASAEFNEIEVVEGASKTPKKKAAKAKRPSPKDEDPEDEEAEEEEEAEENDEEQEAEPKKAAPKRTSSTSSSKAAPPRRAPSRRPSARRAA